MQIIYTGRELADSSFIANALITDAGEFDPNVDSATATQLVLSNPSNGWVTTINGSGFAFDANENLIGGTATSFTITNGTDTIATITGINWNALQFVTAMDAAVTNNDFTGLAAIINQSATITLDASGAMGGYEMQETFGDALYQLTTPITVTGTSGRDTLEGGLANDYINPGSNNDEGDHVYGSLGNDTVDFADAASNSYFFLGYGQFNNLTFDIGTGVDGRITDGTFTDTLRNTDNTPWGLSFAGGAGNDVFNLDNDNINDVWLWRGLQGGRGNDTYNITADYGTSRIDFHWGWGETANQGVVVDIGAGTATNDGFGTSDVINVSYGDGRLSLQGSDFNDQMTGGAGRDEFITRQGDDTVDGGGGIDRLRYDRSGVDGVTVDMVAGTASGTWDGQAFSDTFTSIEQIRGSNGNDTLLGSFGGDFIDGRNGADRIEGRGGNDTLEGRGGNDLMLGGFGFDTMLGGDGDDLMNGGGNTDLLEGGAGNDRLVGDVGFDQLYGDAGNDTLFGGTEADRLYGGTGDDELHGGSNFSLSADRLFGEEGNDTLNGDAGYDFLDGGEGDDLLNGGAQADNLFGRAGNDTLLGGDGLDRLFTGAGDDVADGGNGNDGLFGEAGNDTLNGNDGNDRFFGGSGNDEMNGGAGDDTMNGGSGFDRIDGGTGNDLLFGRFNADTFVFADGHGNDTIADFTAGNRFENIDLSGVGAINSLADLDLGSATNGAATQVGVNVVIDTGGGNSITLTNMLVGDLNADDFLF